ncbi:MAG: hypothetical protein R2703_09370 [Micropruina glycogenica]
MAAHWVKVFGDLAAAAREDGYEDGMDLLWLGVMGWGLHDAMFSLAMFSAMDGFGDMGDMGGLGDAFAHPAAMFDSGAIDGIGRTPSGSTVAPSAARRRLGRLRRWRRRGQAASVVATGAAATSAVVVTSAVSATDCPVLGVTGPRSSWRRQRDLMTLAGLTT